MVKVPIVRISSLIPDPTDTANWLSREITLNGKSIGREFLSTFTYVYNKDGSDECTITLRFTESNIDIGIFSPGMLFQVSWGFLGETLTHQKLAVEDLEGMEKVNGYTLKLTLIPISKYKEKNPGVSSTVSELLSEQNTKLTSVYYDKAGRLIKITYDPKSGYVTDYYRPNKEELKTGFISEGLRKFIVALVTEDFGELFFSNNAKSLGEVEKDSLKDTVFTMIMKFLSERAAGAHVTHRDDEIVISDSDYSASPDYTFVPNKNILGLTFSKPSTKVAAKSHKIALINPIKKQIEGSQSLAYIGKEIFLVDGIATVAEISYYTKAGDVYSQAPGASIEDLVKLTEEEASRVLQEQQKATNREFSEGIKTEDYLKALKDPTKSTPLGVTIDDEGRLFIAETLQLNLFDNKEFSAENVPLVVQQVTSPHPIDLVINERVNAELAELFNNLSATVTIEGQPVIDNFFNFIIAGSSRQVDGKYHAYTVTHSIISAKYTVKIEGGKLPVNPTIIRQKITEKLGVTTKATKAEDGYFNDVAEILNSIEDIVKGISTDSTVYSNDSTRTFTLRGLDAARDVPTSSTVILPKIGKKYDLKEIIRFKNRRDDQ